MNTKIQRQMLSDLLNGRCSTPQQTISKLERSLFADDHLLQIFLAVRASFLSRGEVDVLVVRSWLVGDAATKDEATELTELLAELCRLNQPTDGFDNIDEDTRRFLHPSQIEAGKLIRDPMIRAEYYKACACKGRTGDSNPLKEFQRKYASLITTDSKSVRKR